MRLSIATAGVLATLCTLVACKKPVDPNAVARAVAENQQAEARAVAENQQAEALQKIEVEKQLENKNKALCIAATLAKLKDPDSAKITDMSSLGVINVPLFQGHSSMLRIYEFSLNAKNGYGGYTGRENWRCEFLPEDNKFMGAYKWPP